MLQKRLHSLNHENRITTVITLNIEPRSAVKIKTREKECRKLARMEHRIVLIDSIYKDYQIHLLHLRTAYPALTICVICNCFFFFNYSFFIQYLSIVSALCVLLPPCPQPRPLQTHRLLLLLYGCVSAVATQPIDHKALHPTPTPASASVLFSRLCLVFMQDNGRLPVTFWRASGRLSHCSERFGRLDSPPSPALAYFPFRGFISSPKGER